MYRFLPSGLRESALKHPYFNIIKLIFRTAHCIKIIERIIVIFVLTDIRLFNTFMHHSAITDKKFLCIYVTAFQCCITYENDHDGVLLHCYPFDYNSFALISHNNM